MFRLRTREKYSDEELAEVYRVPHDHSRFPDHRLRVEATIEMARSLDIDGGPYIDDHHGVGADLSTGDAYIPRSLPEISWILGDYAPGYDLTGPIEKTIDQIPSVDLFLLCETLEHLDDPELVLSKIRGKANLLILSTPWMQWRDENIEHYWCWDDEAVGEMLTATGWTEFDYRRTDYDPGYSFQIWGCQ